MMQVSFSPEKRIFSLPPRHRDRIRAIFQRYTGFDAIHRSAEVDAWIARTEETALRALSAEAVCRLEPLSEVTPEGILTCSGIRFSSPRMGEVLRSACGMAAMAVRLRGWEALQGRGDMADGMLYDIWANAVLESASSDLRAALKREIRDRGYFVTPSWSPGQDGIALENQRPLFRLLQPEEIGITLGEDDLMSPIKSVTAFFGFCRERPAERPVPCDLCTDRSYCASAYFEDMYDE